MKFLKITTFLILAVNLLPKEGEGRNFAEDYLAITNLSITSPPASQGRIWVFIIDLETHVTWSGKMGGEGETRMPKITAGEKSLPVRCISSSIGPIQENWL